jgi:hypothetical protein
MNAATANLVIASVWAFLALLLAMFLTAIVRTPQELVAAGPAQHAGQPAGSVARYARTPYIGRHARGRSGHLAAGPPWDPAPEPPALPR